MELTLNRVKIECPAQILVLGELLDWLETNHMPQGHCISRVRLNGKPEMHFQLPRLSQCATEKLQSVDIESGELVQMIRELVSELETELGHALELTRSIIAGNHPASLESDAVVQLIQVLKSVHLLSSRLPSELGWSRPPDAVPGLDAAIRYLSDVQRDLIQTSISEILERDVAPILESCHKTVEQTRMRIG
jgi:hypothetical protein